MSAATKADAAAIANIWEQVVHSTGASSQSWKEIEFPSWLRYLHFHEIKSRLGLSTASLIAFVIGLGCIAGALLVGLLNARTLGGMGSHPVLPRRMAAGRYGRFCRRNSAEETSPEYRRHRRLSASIRSVAAGPRRPPLLIHPVKMVHWPRSLSHRMSVRNRSRDIGLGQQRRLRQSPVQRQVAGHRRRKSASGAVGRIRALPLSLEYFLLDPTLRLESSTDRSPFRDARR